jgi:putative tricarboxylic transport membrane protein
MMTYDRIASVFFFGVGCFFALYARRVEIGSWNEPGPGFLPFWVGGLLALMSFLLFLSTIKEARPQPRPLFFPVSDAWKRVLATFLSLVGYNLLVNPLGFTVTTFAFVAFLVRFVFPQTWTRTLLAAGLSALGARLLFITFLETQLPKGFLGW